MVITDEQLTAFISLYRTHFGRELSPPEARTHAEGLLQFMLLSTSLHKAQSDGIVSEPNSSLYD